MIVLDTNVVSELMRPEPRPSVLMRVNDVPPADVFITAITAAELHYGVARMPEGTRKRVLQTRIAELLTVDFDRQILPFDGTAAAHYGDLVVNRARIGRPIGMADAQIAAICLTWRAQLLTRNIRGFDDTGVDAVDPWADSSGPN